MPSKDEKEKQDCWRFLTTGEKVLLFLLTLTTLVLLTLFLTVIITYLNGERVCHTPNCVAISAKLLNLIDFEQEPCNDFHNFICQNNDNNNRFDSIAIRKKSILKKLLLNDNTNLENPRKFYKSCLISDEDRLDALNSIIAKLEWPLLLGQNWEYTNFNWLKFMVKLRNHGMQYQWLLRFDWVEDANGTKLLQISPPRLAQIPNSAKPACLKTMIETAVIFNSSRTIAKDEMRRVRTFEDNLLTLTDKYSNRSFDDFDTIPITVDELSSYWPEVDLIYLLNDLSKGYTVFTRNTTIVLNPKSFLLELNRLLARTPRRIQADFFVWKTIEAFGPYLPDNLRDLYGEYLTFNSREEYCFDETLRRFYYSIEKQYIDEYITNDTRINIDKIVEFVTNTDNFTVQITNFDTPTDLDFDFVSDNIIEIIGELQYEHENRFFQCLNTNRTCQVFGENRENSGDLLELDDNTIHISNLILHSDYYSFDNPNYLNYAGLGYKIGRLFNGTDHSFETVYLAYIRWSQRYQIEDQLPGLVFSAKQLFWIWAGYLYCNGDDNTTMQQLTQSEYFINDFNCIR